MPAADASQESDVGDVSVADVLAAQARLRRFLPPTPLHHAERFGTWLKLENLQRTGSYKVRGALNALLAGRERGDTRPVICASAGNHAQGVAWAAYRLDVPAITVMPHGAPATKIAGVAHWGATVRQHGNSYDEAYAFAVELAQRHGYRFLSAFDDADVIAGQGTVGIELAAHAPDVVIVPIGGGGLASGVALALKSQGVRVVGAQVEGVDSMARAIRGDVREIAPVASLADGVRVKIPGFLTRRLCTSLLDDVVIVREAELRETLVRLALEEHIIAEAPARWRWPPAAALPAAASARWCPAGTSMPVSWPACSPTSVRARHANRGDGAAKHRARPARPAPPLPPHLPLPPCKPSHPLSRRFPCDHHRTNYHPAHPHLRHHPA